MILFGVKRRENLLFFPQIHANNDVMLGALTKEEKIMGTKDITNSCMTEIFIKTIYIIEKECVRKHKKFEVVAQEILYMDKDYLRCVFSEVAGMGLAKYIQRRQMTEIYFSLKDYESLKLRDTVKGIKRYKEKMKKEFGEPPVNLQLSISAEDVEGRINKTVMRKIQKRYKREIEKTRKKVNLLENKVKIVDCLNNVLYNLDETYFLLENRIILFRGRKELYSAQDYLLTKIIGEPVGSSVTDETSVNEIMLNIQKFFRQEKIDRKAIASLQMEEYEETGVKISNLIGKIVCSEDYIEQLDFLNQHIVYENQELYFVYDGTL